MATPVAGPWTKYAAAQQSPDGPWNKYATATSANPPQQTPEQQAASAQSQGLAPTGKAPVGVQMKQSLLAPAGGTFNPLAASDPDNPITKFLNRPEVQAAMNMAGPTAAASDVAGVAGSIPSAKRASETFQELKGAIGEHTVAMTNKLADALDDIKEASETGSTLPSVINKFATRIADTDKGLLTYNEARQFYSNVSQLSASEKMAAKPNDLRLINQFRVALGDTIKATAESAGKLQQYQQAMKDFSRSKTITDFGQKLIEAIRNHAMEAAIAAGAGATGAAIYKEVSK